MNGPDPREDWDAYQRAARWALRRKTDGKFYATWHDGKSNCSGWFAGSGDLHLETDARWLQTHLGIRGGLERVWVPEGMTFREAYAAQATDRVIEEQAPTDFGVKR